MGDLPSGTVTFLFTDIEGSTRLLDELGPERYAVALGEHRRLVREAFTRRGGVEVDTQGDAFFVVFPEAGEALEAAGEAQRALEAGSIRVRMGLHSGEPVVTDEGTSASTCTERRGSARRHTAGRSSCRRARGAAQR